MLVSDSMPRLESIDVLAEGGPGTRSYAAASLLTVASDVLSRHLQATGGILAPVRKVEILLHDNARLKRTDYGHRTKESDSIYLFTKGSFAQGPNPLRLATMLTFVWMELLNQQDYRWETTALRKAEQALVTSGYVTNVREVRSSTRERTLRLEGDFFVDTTAVRRVTVSTFNGPDVANRFTGSFTGVYTSFDFHKDLHSGALDPYAGESEIGIPGIADARLRRCS